MDPGFWLPEPMPTIWATNVVVGLLLGRDLVETTLLVVCLPSDCRLRSLSRSNTGVLFHASCWVNKVFRLAMLRAGTTILNAISTAVDPSTEIVYSENPNPDFVKSSNFSYAIVVVGETPYSETAGDNLHLTIPEPGLSTLTNVCNSVKCIVVLVSGRPLVVEPYLSSMDALVAAWLPGSEGQGVADVLFGDYGFTGKLPRTWFKTVDQLPMNVGDPNYDPLFPFGYGLTTEPVV
ncbi:hypothetical protein RHSIM_Rhsim13G0197900 [Rhododendron simsii]|uniref:Glycoside hydrolase family 3 C-terminal domain-containing protein n=1 Tax=Rhododendron simsii TaxID=118357 RepID=A0A834FXA5_RHOSS|nr:hypothetical protein RHSIM_Rhsim13G0197900 [Rhododendron simsii]